MKIPSIFKSPLVLIFIVTGIAGIISPVNKFKAGNFFSSVWLCAFEQWNLACIVLLLGTIVLIVWSIIAFTVGVRNVRKDEKQNENDFHR